MENTLEHCFTFEWTITVILGLFPSIMTAGMQSTDACSLSRLT